MAKYLVSLFLVFAITSCSTPSDPDANEDPKDTTVVRGSVAGVITRAYLTDPIAGVRVTTVPSSTEAITDDNGSYELDSIPPGTYELRFEKSGFAASTRSITILDSVRKSIDVQMHELSADGKGHIHFLVVDRHTMRPISSLEFRHEAEVVGITDNDGRFTFIGEKNSSRLLRVSRYGLQGGEIRVTITDPIVRYDTIELEEQAELLAHYTFAGNSLDSSGRGHHAQLTGGRFVTDRNGLKDRAIELDGLNDFLQVAHSDDLNFGVTDDITICFWIKCSSPQSPSEPLIRKGSGEGEDFVGYEASMRTRSGQSESEATFGTDFGAATVSLQYQSHLNTGSWVFVAVRVDRSKRTIDFGNRFGNDSFEEQVLGGNMDNTADLFIGRRGNEYFKGALDEIMIFRGYVPINLLDELGER